MLSTRNPADVDKWYDEIRGQIRTRSNPREGHSNSLVIALTSMKSGEGVTTAALGLARSFERESRGEVLMILAKETPRDFDSIFVGVKPRVIGDDLLFASTDDPEWDRSEPYLVLPPTPDRGTSDSRPHEPMDEETLDIVGEPANDGAAVRDREHDLPAEELEPSSDVVNLPQDVIQRFGGIRPMARAMKVPASTVASWKRRGRIPRHRRQEIAEALGEPVLAEGPESEDGTSSNRGTNHGANQGPGRPAGPGAKLGNPKERLAHELLKPGGLRAAEVIDLFGGTQGLANALDMPMTTVQGWETENHIPELYHATIRLAAHDRGGSLDAAELPITSPAPPPTTQEHDPPPNRRTSLIPPEAASHAYEEDVLPVWQSDAARPGERFIVSLGEAGPDVMALGTCGLNGSGYGRRWENTFRQLRETYSVIIIDASSLETPIPKMWREQTTQTLLVIDSTKTTANELRRMSRLTDLPSLRLSGTILNKTVR